MPQRRSAVIHEREKMGYTGQNMVKYVCHVKSILEYTFLESQNARILLKRRVRIE